MSLAVCYCYMLLRAGITSFWFECASQITRVAW